MDIVTNIGMPEVARRGDGALIEGIAVGPDYVDFFVSVLGKHRGGVFMQRPPVTAEF